MHRTVAPPTPVAAALAPLAKVFRRFSSTIFATLAMLFAGLVTPFAHAQTCSPSGTPIARSPLNDHYFVYNGKTIVLGGMSYEYLCHVPIPSTSSWYQVYCALGNAPTTLATLDGDSTNVVRISTVFNTSPGMYVGYTQDGVVSPFPLEQPFKWNGTKWDLSTIDPAYITNLQTLACYVYDQFQMFLEVTLLDPWNPNEQFKISPFNSINTMTGSQGFTASQYFGDESQDSVSQNATARTYQRNAVAAIVKALKAFPNVIWNLANEPDLGPATVGNVMTWQTDMAKVIQQYDSTPPHLLLINGHTSSAFAWNMVGKSLGDVTAQSNLVQTSHYTRINPVNAGLEGAIALLDNPTYASETATYPLGFDENWAVPNANFPLRTTADVRAEAWEYLLGGGGLFNAYTNVMSSSLAQQASVQIGGVTSYLNYTNDLAGLQQTICNSSGAWCSLAAYGTADPGNGCTTTPTANAYFGAVAGMDGGDNRLYIHHGELMSTMPNGPTKFDGYHELTCGNGSTNGYRSPVHVTVQLSGCWVAIWFDPVSFVQRLDQYVVLKANTPTALTPPYYTDDILLELSYLNAGTTCTG